MKPFANVLLMEWYAAREFWQFARRHRRYLSTAVFLYLYSLKSIRYAHNLRIGFAVLQYLDDVLDGDRKIDEDALLHVDRLTTPIDTHDKWASQDRMQQLINYFFYILDKSKNEIHNTRDDFFILLDRLKFDYTRRQERLILPAAKLISHHHLTFYHSVNLLLALSGSHKGAAEEDEVVQAFCWCSPIRDIREDFAIGLVNVPLEVLEDSGVRGKEVFETQAYRDWEREEYNKVRLTFDQYAGKQHKDPLAGYFMKALKIYFNQYAQKRGR